MIRIEIPLAPKAQQRARVGKFGGYKTKSQRLNDEKLIFHLNKHRQEPLLAGAIKLVVECYFQRPQKHFSKRKGIPIVKNDAPHFHTSTPDWDNLGKQICDCGSGIIWKDDRYIADGRVIKYYSACGEPKVIINISEIGW
jgi:Holliday junction resolvase RusA-like endonuclease